MWRAENRIVKIGTKSLLYSVDMPATRAYNEINGRAAWSAQSTYRGKTGECGACFFVHIITCENYHEHPMQVQPRIDWEVLNGR